MSSTKPIRWGILGCARITRRGLIPGIRESHSSTLLALASRQQTSSDEWAKEFNIPRAYGSYEALLADPDIDAVYIPLPNELHLDWTKAAADAGKHVLCEKPVARDAAEALAMADHCKQRGVILMEAFMWRYAPRIVEIRRRIEAGEIGTLRVINVSFSFSIDPTDWRLDPTRGGGALFDVGCYGVNAARLFTQSEPESSQTLVKRGPTGVDMTLATHLGFANGVIGNIDCSFELPYRNRLELVGTGGSITVLDAFLPGPNPTATLLRLGSDSGAAEPETLHFDGRNQYAAMVDHFAASIHAGHLLAPAEDGVAQMKVIDAVLRGAVNI